MTDLQAQRAAKAGRERGGRVESEGERRFYLLFYPLVSNRLLETKAKTVAALKSSMSFNSC